MKPEDLTDQVVEVLRARFHVIKAQVWDDNDWSLVGYWLNENQEPETPHIQHVVVSPEFILPVDESSV